MKRLAVLGQPIAHSRSPAMHTAALAELGLAGEWSYEAIELAPADFERRVQELPAGGFVGVNVTIPHKEAALRLADEASEAARAIGAANTLSFREGAMRADNTDAPGLLAALPAPPAGRRALVLGAGGAARAAVWALREGGAEVTVLNRTAERGERLARAFGVGAVRPGEEVRAEAYELIVNATSIGLAPPAGDGLSSPELAAFKSLGLDTDGFGDRQVVVDLVYGSAETELVGAARARGAATVDGLEILVRQGAESLRIWTGLEPPLETMRRAVRSRSTDEPRSEPPRPPEAGPPARGGRRRDAR